MWTFDMNRCNQCPKIRECPDRIAIHKGLKNTIDAVEGNNGGSRSGMLVMICHEPQLIAEEKGTAPVYGRSNAES